MYLHELSLSDSSFYCMMQLLWLKSETKTTEEKTDYCQTIVSSVGRLVASLSVVIASVGVMAVEVDEPIGTRVCNDRGR
jgi:hypothetical protein